VGLFVKGCIVIVCVYVSERLCYDSVCVCVCEGLCVIVCEGKGCV